MFSNTQNRPKSTTEKERQANVRLGSDATSDYNNPCIKEQKLVYKCLDTNNYDYDKCKAFVVNYKACKQFWSDVRADRLKHGVNPGLPWPDEREKVKDEYLTKWNFKPSK